MSPKIFTFLRHSGFKSRFYYQFYSWFWWKYFLHFAHKLVTALEKKVKFSIFCKLVLKTKKQKHHRNKSKNYYFKYLQFRTSIASTFYKWCCIAGWWSACSQYLEKKNFYLFYLPQTSCFLHYIKHFNLVRLTCRCFPLCHN